MRGAAVMLPATLVGYALLLGVDVVANHLLDVEAYGLYSNVRRAVQLAGFVTLLGMENAVIRVVGRAPGEAAARAGLRTALMASTLAGGLAALVLMAAAPALAAHLDPSPSTLLCLQIGACALPFWSIRTVTVAGCQGYGTLVPRALVTFLVWPIVQLGGLFLAVSALGLGSAGAVGSFTLAVALGALQGLWHLRRTAPRAAILPGEAGEGAWGPMWAVAWPLWLHGVGMALYTWADQLLLGGLAGERAAGLYGPVAQLGPLFGVGLGALNGAFAPVIARKHHEGDKAGLAELYRVVTRWAVVIAMPAVVLALLAPRSVLSPWHHVSDDTVTALQITAAGQLVCTAVGSVNYLLLMSGRPRDPLWNAIPAVVVSFLASWLLIPSWGVVGAATANALAMMLANLLGLYQVWRHLGLHPAHKGLVRPLFAALPMAFLVIGCQEAFGDGWVTLAVGGGVGGLSLLGFLSILGLDAGDRLVVDWVRSRVRRSA